MALKECKIKDFMRGKDEEEIIVQFDPEDLIKLPCHAKYDPALCGEKNKEVMLVRKIEIKNGDGSWGPYPSVTWLEGLESEKAFRTRAFVKITGEKGFDIMSSCDGVPDADLMMAAENAGVHTEFL